MHDAARRTGIEVIASSVLSNHVHALVSFRPDTRLSDFVRLSKSITARVANHEHARGYDLITGALDGWRIHRDEAGAEPDYRIIELRPV